MKPNRDSSWLAQVAQKRQNGEIQVPTHSLATVYRYNTLNQVVTQYSPDGGYSKFWYDRLGRLSVSQNAKQLLETKYSYTKYDVLGRITEVGQKPQTVAMTQVISRNPGQLTDWLNQTYTNTNGDRTMSEQVTATMYDLVDITTTDLPLVIPVNQKSYTLRNRVSYTRTYDYLLALEDNTPRYSLYDFSSTYSYDIHGNVDTLLQQYRTGLLGAHGDNRFKVIAYKYDLVSGKVNQVHYQPGQRDQLYHRYVYDAENRLTDVYVTDSKATINDRDLEEHDAHYEYYKHGPLARTVLGNQQVQGLDYAYTLQGWLKGVNSTGLTTNLDMGNDSKADDRHPLVARDVFGFNLNYFTGDYAAISGKNVFPGHTGIISPSTAYRALYNGNISSMAVNIGKFNQPQLYNYQYDQLNRLVAMDVFRGYVTGSNSWSAITQVNDYKERISYDGNGNILSYLRNGTTADSGPITMDSMSYKYFTNTDGTYRNNRLRLVRDSVATGNYSVDIDDQLPRVSNAADSNYVYDAIGNLIQDKSENITNIQWTVYGKIQKITKTAVNTGDVSAISYWYDAAGNRVGKKVEALNRKPQYSWYTRDASGNVMGVYQYEGNTLTDDTLRLREHHLYGSSRIGVWNRWINMDLPVSTGTTINLLGKSYDGTFERGNKFFELSNHLGNVLATVSDKKFGHNGGSGVVDYYDADVVTASDYYPFGMLMPGRQFGQGENFPGVLVNGTTTVNGYSLPIDLNLTSRGAGDAAEYVASNSVEFDGEFESSSTDEFSAYIADNTYAGTGNQVSGGGAYGTAGRYRYGFNGKENDNEVKGVGNQQDYGMRIYDSRVGKFLSVDPLYASFPWNSTYAFAENEPLSNVDLDGTEKAKSNSFSNFLGGGIKQGINEFTQDIKSYSKATFSNQTYRDVWNNVVIYSRTAFNNPTIAIKQFSDGTFNISMAFSNSVQGVTTEPLMWIVGMPNRSKEENVKGIGYGMWKGLELYGMIKLPEILNKISTPSVASYEGNEIIAKSLRSGAKLVIVEGEEIRLMQVLGKDAGIRWLGNGIADLQVASKATRMAILEEAIHYQQYLKYGEEFMSSRIGQASAEIEAQNTLLRIGKK